MKSVTTRPLLAALTGAAVFGLLVPTVLAHGGDEGGHSGHGGMEMTDADKPRPEEEYPLTYFAHPDHKTAIYAHIALMVLAWVFMLPVGKEHTALRHLGVLKGKESSRMLTEATHRCHALYCPFTV